MKRYMVVLILICILLTGCNPFQRYEENMTKFDSKDYKTRFRNPAPDLQHVKEQELKDIPVSFKLENGLDEFQALDIVKSVKIIRNKIDVEFIAKKMDDEDKENVSEEKIIWNNTLNLLYIIVDTFPEIEKIRLHCNYYYQDKFGNPYSETVFISNTSSKVVKKINRQYFRPDMLKDVIDFYISGSVSDKKKSEAK